MFRFSKPKLGEESNRDNADKGEAGNLEWSCYREDSLTREGKLLGKDSQEQEERKIPGPFLND